MKRVSVFAFIFCLGFTFAGNAETYGGPRKFLERVIDREDTGSQKEDFLNYGSFVEKRGALGDLAQRIIGTRKATPEAKIQKLLDFVTEKIEYDRSPTNVDGSTLRSISEVLHLRRGECSSKVVLYASLLEEIGVDYLIAYAPRGEAGGHLTVLVSGNFPLENGRTLAWRGVMYHVAETTFPRFRIGRTQTPGLRMEEIEFVQRPGEAVINLQSGRPLPFIE